MQQEISEKDKRIILEAMASSDFKERLKSISMMTDGDVKGCILDLLMSVALSPSTIRQLKYARGVSLAMYVVPIGVALIGKGVPEERIDWQSESSRMTVHLEHFTVQLMDEKHTLQPSRVYVVNAIQTPGGQLKGREITLNSDNAADALLWADRVYEFFYDQVSGDILKEQKNEMVLEMKYITAHALVEEAMSNFEYNYATIRQKYRVRLDVFFPRRKVFTFYIPYSKMEKLIPRLPMHIASIKEMIDDYGSLFNISQLR